MVEKIYVRPEEVRGLGNIVIPKSLEDYETYESVLVEGSDEVYGTVYTMSYNHVPDFDEIVLSSDKDILSYNGGTNPDVAVLTAQLTNAEEPVAVSGETVTFEVHKQSDDSLIETLTGETDSSGKATVSYTSKGAGDLYIKSKCGLVSKRYTIEDIYFYDSGAVDHTSRYSSHYTYWGNLSNPTLTQENDYYKIVPSSTSAENSWIGNQLPVSSSLDNYELSVDIKTNITGGNNGVGVGIIQGSQKGIGLTQSNSDTVKHLVLYNPYDGGGNIANQVAVSGFHIDDWHTYKLTKNGTTVKFEILYGGTVLWSYTKTGIASNLATQTIPCLTINGSPIKSHWGYYKNIKVREL